MPVQIAVFYKPVQYGHLPDFFTILAVQAHTGPYTCRPRRRRQLFDMSIIFLP